MMLVIPGAHLLACHTLSTQLHRALVTQLILLMQAIRQAISHLAGTL